METSNEPEFTVEEMKINAPEITATNMNKLNKNVALDEDVHHRLVLYKVHNRCKTLRDALDLLLKAQGVA